MATYRQKLRRAGLRPIQIWVPDTRAPGFAEEIARQSRVLAASEGDKEVLDWMEDNIDWPNYDWD